MLTTLAHAEGARASADADAAQYLAMSSSAECAESVSATQASSTPATLEQRFGGLDSNGDGGIAWEEAVPSRQEDFVRMDVNLRIMPAECSGAMAFGTFDKNTDGVIAQAEYLATHRMMLMKFDADADQRISISVFAAAQQAAGK